MQTCHFDLTGNLNLTTKIAFLYRNLYQIKSQKNLTFVSGYLNFTKFFIKKIWKIGRSGSCVICSQAYSTKQIKPSKGHSTDTLMQLLSEV